MVEGCPQSRFPSALKLAKCKDVLGVDACMGEEMQAGLLAAFAAVCFSTAEDFQAYLGNGSVSKSLGIVPVTQGRCAV